MTAEQRDVLTRVSWGRPLSQADHDTVLSLTRSHLMHVTPTFDRADKCPYRLTDAGRAALSEATR